MADYLRGWLDRVSDAASRRPAVALAVTNAVTAVVVGVLIASEGRPLAWLKKKVFRAALAAVPASVMDAEMAKVKRSIEHSVIGTTLEGLTLVPELPERGWSAETVSTTLKEYGARDSANWKKGKVHFAVHRPPTPRKRLWRQRRRRDPPPVSSSRWHCHRRRHTNLSPRAGVGRRVSRRR